MPALSSLILAGTALVGGAMLGKSMSQKQQEMPALPKPEPPVAMPETGAADITRQKKILTAGRGGTILAGQLAPQNIFKRRLLG